MGGVRLPFQRHCLSYVARILTVSLVKIIVITLALILSLLLFGRFLF
jgi:hypothetical protein